MKISKKEKQLAIEKLQARLKDAFKNERHMSHKETYYWFDQYKMLATEAIKLLGER